MLFGARLRRRVQKNRDVPRTSVSDGEVRPAVAVEIAHGSSLRVTSRPKCKSSGGLERAITVAQQDRHAIRAGIRDRQVHMAIEIEVSDADGNRTYPGVKGLRRGKGAIGMAKQLPQCTASGSSGRMGSRFRCAKAGERMIPWFKVCRLMG